MKLTHTKQDNYATGGMVLRREVKELLLAYAHNSSAQQSKHHYARLRATSTRSLDLALFGHGGSALAFR
jgi:hypothetical protein